MSAPPTRDELAELARAIPSQVRFGTSTWTYPGWTGLVYSQLYPESKATTRMLGEYARWPLFRTVGVDSSFYGPPKATTLASWAKVLPEGFLAVSKVWDRVTAFRFAGAREDAGRKNPDWLNAELFRDEVWNLYRAHFARHTGPFVFEFQSIAARDRISADEFVSRLDGFLGELPEDGAYAVEVRNEEFLTPAYFAVLREHDVAHVFNSWTRMPSLGEQLDLPEAVTGRFLVARALLRPGRTYSEAVDRFAPYDRIREPNPRLRADLTRLARLSAALRIPAYLLVNNRAEGSAPLTITAVARMLAGRDR